MNWRHKSAEVYTEFSIQCMAKAILLKKLNVAEQVKKRKLGIFNYVYNKIYSTTSPATIRIFHITIAPALAIRVLVSDAVSMC